MPIEYELKPAELTEVRKAADRMGTPLTRAIQDMLSLSLSTTTVLLGRCPQERVVNVSIDTHTLPPVA